MKAFVQDTTLMGRVSQVDPPRHCFELTCRSGDRFEVFVGPTTRYEPVENIDGLNRDRVPTPPGFVGDLASQAEKYIQLDALVAVQGVYQDYEGSRRFDARIVHLSHSGSQLYLFEETHWWLTQIARLADEWLDDLFGDRRTYSLDDFAALYRTNLNILGLPTDDNVQEMATLSRLIYGLSSAYLLTGTERYLLAAAAGVQYQRSTFRSLSHDGKYCFWAFGKRRGKYGSSLIVPSENSDDFGSIPLYEQIYALAGLAQYYRITAEWEVLEDIRRTVRAFNDYYLDDRTKNETFNEDFPNQGGYFSHLDYVTMRPDVEALGDNRSRKNWNSVGDHIPAYLINLILALDPLPEERSRDLSEFVATCKWMLETTSDLIVEKLPDPDPNIPYVNERFYADWSPDHSFRWQQNRAVVGHNLKIAWNLTRVANYYQTVGNKNKADRLSELAVRLGRDMVRSGLDLLRSGCYDMVEREPGDGLPLEFVWGTTKDFWQQEQAILAYLILYGYTGDREFLELARELSFFWNLFFLDHDNRGIFNRVTDDGSPVIRERYGYKGSHSMGGYHSFELNYLAHTYIRMYAPSALKEEYGDQHFCLYFKPHVDSHRHSINVLPDFVKPGDLEVAGITVDGVPRSSVDADNFQIPLEPSDLGSSVIVEFRPHRRR